MAIQKVECHVCKRKIDVKPARKCCLCQKPTCPNHMVNRMHKRRTYYMCNRCQASYNPETIEQKAKVG